MKPADPDRPPPAPSSPKPPSSRLRAALPLIPLAVGLLLLAAVVVLGWLASQALRGQDRYRIAFGDIECTPPPGLSRETFLDEVQYFAGLPDAVCVLDDGLPARLSAAFAKHPWVEQVEAVEVAAPRRVRVRLAYRTAVLRVARPRRGAMGGGRERRPPARGRGGRRRCRRWPATCGRRRGRRGGRGATTACRGRRGRRRCSARIRISIKSPHGRNKPGRPDAAGRRLARPLGRGARLRAAGRGGGRREGAAAAGFRRAARRRHGAGPAAPIKAYTSLKRVLGKRQLASMMTPEAPPTGVCSWNTNCGKPLSPFCWPWTIPRRSPASTSATGTS